MGSRHDNENLFSVSFLDNFVIDFPLPDQVIGNRTTTTTNATATDADLPANPLTFSLAAGPVGLVLDPNTGAVTWTPTEAQGPSSNWVVVVVTDLNTNAVNQQQLSVTNGFSVVVHEPS